MTERVASAAPSYARGESSVPLLSETIGQNLRRTAQRVPDADALISIEQGIRMTYAEFDAEVDRLARALIGMDLRRGDRVGIWAPNLAQWMLLQYATARVGVILVTINPAYRQHELAYTLQQSGCRLLFAVTEFKTSRYAEMIAAVIPDVATLEQVCFIDTADWGVFLARGAASLEGALAEREAQVLFDDAINIQYTSGTTGFPKGATLTHHNILNNGYFVGERCGYTERDRVCVPVPFYHCFGMVMGNLASTSHGAAVVIPSAGFDAAATLQAVQDERCTSLYGVPTMFIAEQALQDFGTYDLSSLRTGIMAGSPCPTETMRRCIDEMGLTEVTICYGMTETSPVSTQTMADDPLDKRVSTVGRVHPHVEVKVIDPLSGQIVPRGTAGELCTRAYSVMLGYWDAPEQTAEAVDPSGWMHTGDLATMDADGYLAIVGRIKDMIIRGGENIYPREIEEFLHTHPDIVDVHVIGVPDARYGEEVMAWVRPRHGVTLTREDVAAFSEHKLARYKVPRYVHQVDEFPMTISGKVQKYVMREKSIDLLALDAINTRNPR